MALVTVVSVASTAMMVVQLPIQAQPNSVETGQTMTATVRPMRAVAVTMGNLFGVTQAPLGQPVLDDVVKVFRSVSPVSFQPVKTPSPDRRGV